MARWTPQHEVVLARFTSATRYDVRRDLKGPLLAVLDTVEKILAEYMRVTLVGACNSLAMTI